jgi:hypothetical protein
MDQPILAECLATEVVASNLHNLIANWRESPYFSSTDLSVMSLIFMFLSVL